MPTVQERMICTAAPFSSSGRIPNDVFAGTVKLALPSSSTGTVPRTCLMSQLLWTPTDSCPPLSR